MIPQNRYSQRAAQNLLEYLVTDLDRAMSERRVLEEIWLRYMKKYRAQPDQDEKNFPWPGSSNLVISLVANDVDVITSRELAMLFGQPNLWTCTHKREDMVEFAKKAQKFLEWAQGAEIDAYPAIRDFVIEKAILGTGVLKTRYHRESRKVYEFRETPQGVHEQQAVVMLKNHPRVHHVGLFDYYVPASATSQEDAIWQAERIQLTASQIRNRMAAGIYMPNDRMRTATPNLPNHWQRQVQEFDKFRVSRPDHFDVYEFWLNWDIDEDGQDEALVCTIHRDTRSYLRIDFNPFFNQEAPYDVARYWPLPKRFYGIGVAEMLEGYQDEVSTLHNQRIDLGTVNNASVIVARKNGSIKQDEEIYPGRIILTDDPQSDIAVHPLGGASAENSTIPQEQMTLQYARGRTGVNDFIAGDSNTSANYSAATTAVQQLREGQKRFDQTMRETRRAVAGSGQKVLELYQQFSQGTKAFMALGPVDGQKVMQVLNFPMDFIRASVAVDVTATSAQHNKEVEIRTDSIIMQMLQQYSMQMMQLLQIILNPMTPPPFKMMAMVIGTSQGILLKRIFENYGVQDAERLVPELQEVMGGLQQQVGPLGGTFAGANPMGAGFAGAPGMAALGPGVGGVLPNGAASPQGF